MGIRLLKISIVFVFFVLLGFAFQWVADFAKDEGMIVEYPGDPTKVVEEYLRAVEQERWVEAFNLYFHPTLRTEAVKLLPQLTSQRPLRKEFQNLQMRVVAANSTQAVVRVFYTLDMVHSNSVRERRDVLLNFFLEYVNDKEWLIFYIEDVPIV